MEKLSSIICEDYSDLVLYRFFASGFLCFVPQILKLSLLLQIIIPILSFVFSFLIHIICDEVSFLGASLSIALDLFLSSSWLFAFFVIISHSKFHMNVIGCIMVFIVLLLYFFFINFSVLISIFAYLNNKFKNKIIFASISFILIILFIAYIFGIYYLSTIYVNFYMKISSTYSPYRDSWLHWIFNY
ncbi:hypothetical protein [Ruminococcus sp.]|uniref:hypothetical protein n=1 Tax=Ruminococcus sp. TaxID=41978 RepID=UPI003F03C1D5